MKDSIENSIHSLITFLGDTLKRFSLWRYVIILGLANVLSIVRLFIYAKVISVEEFGYYATFTLVSSVFVIVGSLGFLTELQRRLPIYFEDKNTFKILVSIAQIIIIVLGVFLLSILISFLDISILDIGRDGMLIGVFGGLSQLLFSIITSETRSRQLMIRFSSEILIKNSLSLIAGFALAFNFSNGSWIFLAESFTTMIVAVILYGRLRSEFDMYGFSKILRATLHEFKQLNWYSVLSMLAIGVLAFAMQNGERYFAKSNLPIHSFAILSFGLIIPNIANTIQAIFNSSIFVNQVLRFHQHGRSGVVTYSVKMTLIFVSFFAALSLPMYLVTREAIPIFYPKYIQIIPYLPLIFMAFVIRSSDYISSIYIVLNRPQYIVMIQCIYVMLLSIVFFLFSEDIDLANPFYYFILNFANALIPVIMIVLIIRFRK